MAKETLLTAAEIAKILGLSVETVWRYTREKRIPYLEMGKRQYRYKEEEVLAALKTSEFTFKEEPAGYSTKLTYQDYANLPEEPGYTIELIDGCIVREPSPSLAHQRVSIRLQMILFAYFQKEDPHAEVLDAPLDLYLDKHTIVQPDLLLFSGDEPPTETPIKSRPKLVVEILSPSSVRTDRVRKLNYYYKAKIPHYWLVDPNEGLIECYELHENGYLAVVRFSEGTFTHPSFTDLSFELADIFPVPNQ